MDGQQAVGQDAGSGWNVDVEKSVEDIVGGQSNERASVATSVSEERTFEESKTEENKVSMTRIGAITEENLVFDRKNGRKKGKKKTKDQIVG